jgi:ribulose-phosphate 3-epimerase
LSWLPRHDNTVVAPSLLAVDFSNLEQNLSLLADSGADIFHLDIMDGHFVPNITMGPFVIKAIRKSTDLLLDAHLMISRPDLYVDSFVESGVDAITIHVECDSDVGSVLNQIKGHRKQAGISIKPGTAVSEIKQYLSEIDLVLVMSVEPGFGGQSFDESAVGKIKELCSLRAENGWSYEISVDGGINSETGKKCVDAGADVLVSGSWLINSDNLTESMKKLASLK